MVWAIIKGSESVGQRGRNQFSMIALALVQPVGPDCRATSNILSLRGEAVSVCRARRDAQIHLGRSRPSSLFVVTLVARQSCI